MLKRLLLIACLAIASTTASAAPTDYYLQTSQSRVGFTWYFGDDAISGSMPVSRADISLDFDAPNRSRVFVALNADRARAGAALANSAMKGRSVLWTERFPEITFQSRRITRDGSGGATVVGDLTVRGVTRSQTLTARLFRPGDAEAGDRRRLTIRLEGDLSRSAFGASGFDNLVGDRIELDIQAMIESK